MILVNLNNPNDYQKILVPKSDKFIFGVRQESEEKNSVIINL